MKLAKSGKKEPSLWSLEECMQAGKYWLVHFQFRNLITGQEDTYVFVRNPVQSNFRDFTLSSIINRILFLATTTTTTTLTFV